VRRISIALLTPDNHKAGVEFTWKGRKDTQPPYLDWATYRGFFEVRGDGNSNCFFLSLGYLADIPENISCKEFRLETPEGVEVKEVTFSSLPSEIPLKKCPMPELEKAINQALDECRSNPRDDQRTLHALQSLEKAVPSYDCRRSYDYEPIPAWWMASYQVMDNWIGYLYKKVRENNKYALKIYVEFLNASDGDIAEEMDDQIWTILHDRPMFVLENWERIKDYRDRVLGSVYMQPYGSDVEMIKIYREVARKNPRYKSICEEIIGILEKKNPN
jgi:hypothetical protein